MNGIYRFHVHGHLDDRWSEWLGGFAVQRQDDGTTVLRGPVADQAALHGVIACIRDLGLTLLAVDSEGRSAWEARGSPIGEFPQPEHLPFTGGLSTSTDDIEGGTSCD
jgi:hypothetical protein